MSFARPVILIERFLTKVNGRYFPKGYVYPTVLYVCGAICISLLTHLIGM
jgi:hypothetical protein